MDEAMRWSNGDEAELTWGQTPSSWKKLFPGLLKNTWIGCKYVAVDIIHFLRASWTERLSLLFPYLNCASVYSRGTASGIPGMLTNIDVSRKEIVVALYTATPTPNQLASNNSLTDLHLKSPGHLGIIKWAGPRQLISSAFPNKPAP